MEADASHAVQSRLEELRCVSINMGSVTNLPKASSYSEFYVGLSLVRRTTHSTWPCVDPAMARVGLAGGAARACWREQNGEEPVRCRRELTCMPAQQRLNFVFEENQQPNSLEVTLYGQQGPRADPLGRQRVPLAADMVSRAFCQKA